MDNLQEFEGLDVLNSRPDLIMHVMATVSDAMLILTPEMTVEVANRAFHQIFQTTPQMTNGRSLYELGEGEWDMPELRRLMHDVLPNQNPVLNYRVKRPFRDIGLKTILANAVKLEQQGNMPERILLILRDVSALEAAHEELNLHNRAMDEATNAIIITEGTPDYPIVYVNQAFTEMTGYTVQEVLGQNCRFLQGPDTDRDVLAAIRQAIQSAQKTQQTLLNYRKDGSRFWNQLTISPVMEDGKSKHFIGIQADVTLLRDHMQQQETDNNEITALNARLARAMRETHHRVKNNLQIINAMLDMLVADNPQMMPTEEVATLTNVIKAMAAVHDVLTGQSKTDPLTTTTSMPQILAKVTEAVSTTMGERQKTARS